MQSLSELAMLQIWERPRIEHTSLLLATAWPAETQAALDDLSIGERTGRLLMVHEQTFGPDLRGYAECPACREPLELDLHIPALLSGAATGSPTYGRMESGGYSIEFRLLSGRDLAAAAMCAEPQAARQLLLERCVVSATRHGRPVPAKRLPARVVAELGQRLIEADPRAELMLNVACPACGHAWSVGLDVSVFLWTRMRAHARRLLGEVHTLAAAYGWREADILTMSPRRRQAYLELVGA